MSDEFLGDIRDNGVFQMRKPAAAPPQEFRVYSAHDRKLMEWKDCGCMSITLGQGKAFVPCAPHQVGIEALIS